jgi:hypothetical protein
MNNVFYNVVLYPADYEWHGVKHACETLDQMENEVPIYWTRDKAKARAEARRWSKKGRMAEVFESDFNPILRVDFSYRPDPARACAALLAVLR